MTERRPSNLADAGFIRRRHRHGRFVPAGVLSRRRARQIVIAGTTALVAAAAVLGYTTQEPDAALPLPAAQIPLGPAGSESSVGTGGPPSAGAGAEPSGSLPVPGNGASSTPRPAPTSVAPGRPAPSPDSRTPPPKKTAPPPPAKPRLVGPASLAGFDNFLDDFCEEQGFRRALLLNGRRTPTTGRWVCARFTRFDTIDLDDACQDSFGGSARARAQVAGDIRTVRCFNSP